MTPTGGGILITPWTAFAAASIGLFIAIAVVLMAAFLMISQRDAAKVTGLLEGRITAWETWKAAHDESAVQAVMVMVDNQRYMMHLLKVLAEKSGHIYCDECPKKGNGHNL